MPLLCITITDGTLLFVRRNESKVYHDISLHKSSYIKLEMKGVESVFDFSVLYFAFCNENQLDDTIKSHQVLGSPIRLSNSNDKSKIYLFVVGSIGHLSVWAIYRRKQRQEHAFKRTLVRRRCCPAE